MRLIAAVIVLVAVYFIQKQLYRKYWDKSLDMSLCFSRDFIECGETAELVEVVSNDKLLPLPVFHMKFSIDKSLQFEETENASITDLYHKNQVFSIMGHQRITRRLEFTGTERGVITLNNASILVHDFFMTSHYARRIPDYDCIYVFPKKLKTENFDLKFRGIMGELETKNGIITDNLTYRGIREYQPFDPYRSINWKQSAKARELMVNIYGYTTDSNVRIMLNLDNDYMIETDKLLEESISLVSTFAKRLTEKAVNVSLVTNGVMKDGTPLRPVPDGAERRHSITIDKTLTEIRGSSGKDAFLSMLEHELSDIRRDTLYLVVSPYAKEDMMMLLDRMEAAGGTVHLIVPYYDEYPYKPDRPYSDGWEVSINV
ncbi:MAG: DUF58 domain-containing protein [Eubacterium sp.]|nr:DUF58 domain-containing protein [Eubacterium sp.]